MPKVRVTKLGPVDSPDIQTAKPEEYVHGEANPKSPPTGYWLEGELMSPITVGKPICVWRTIRNGVRVDGLFTSSRVVHITAVYDATRPTLAPTQEFVYTHNSIYRVTHL